MSAAAISGDITVSENMARVSRTRATHNHLRTDGAETVLHFPVSVYPPSLSLALPHWLRAYCLSSAELKDIHLCPTMFPALLSYILLHPLVPVVKIPSPS